MSVEKKRGRPSIADGPMTAAERKQRHREKLAVLGKVTVTVDLPATTVEMIDRHRRLMAELSRASALSRSEQIESALERWAEEQAEAMPKLIQMAKDKGIDIGNWYPNK